MKSDDLACFIYGDLPLWERRAVSALAETLAPRAGGDVDIALNRSLPQGAATAEAVWVSTRHWRRFLGEARRLRSTRVYLSIFNLGNLHPSLPTLFLRKFRPGLPHNVQIVAHSPLTYRFFREIEGLDENRVKLLPLPCVGPETAAPRADKSFTVGILDVFNREANLNYVLSLAHYLVQRDQTLRFRLIGVGRLLGHARAMIRDLGLGARVQVVESAAGDGLTELDLMLYVPLRNDHFAGLLSAAAARVPVLATELPGIEDYVTEGKDGYILPLHEVRPMGELVLRFAHEPSLRDGFAERLQTSLRERFSMERVGARWRDYLAGAGARKSSMATAAA